MNACSHHRKVEILSREVQMTIELPIADSTKKAIAMERRLYFKICMSCGSKNPIDAVRCRKCKRSDSLRVKNRTTGPKK
jgi:large subunit ribosomal protein L40e